MKPLVIALQAAFGATLLVGCATPGGVAPEVKPYLAIRDGGTKADDYYQLGRYYQSKERVREAADAYRRAITLDDRHAEAHNALGAIHASNHSFAEARAELERAIAIDPSAAHFRSNLGYAYYLQGKADEAIVEYQTAAALDPASARIWNNMGLALAQLGRVDLANQAFARATALASGHAVPPPPVLARAAPDAAKAKSGQRAGESAAAGTIVVAPPMIAPVDAPVSQANELAMNSDPPASTNKSDDATGSALPPFAAIDEMRPASLSSITARRTLEPLPAQVPLSSVTAHRILEPLQAAASLEMLAALANPVTPSTTEVALEAAMQPAKPSAALEPVAAVDVPWIAPMQIAGATLDEPLRLIPIEALPPAIATAPAPFEPLSPTAVPSLAFVGVAALPYVADVDTVQTWQPAAVDAGRREAASVAEPATTDVFEVPARADIVALAPNVLELRWTGHALFARPTVPVATAVPERVRLEVSNGNGVTGMARKVDGLLREVGLPKARLTNQKPFNQPYTEIQYRLGHATQAAALSARLPNRPRIVCASGLRGDIDVRLVLGRDLPRSVGLVDPSGAAATRTAATAAPMNTDRR